MQELPVDVPTLMSLVKRESGDRPLENLTAAQEAATRLTALGDALIGAFVDEARASGLSWTQIGTSLGVTRQAVQQRYVAPPRDPAPVGPDGIRTKPAPFSAVRPGDAGVEVQVEIGGAWYDLVELDGLPAAELIAATKRHYRARWLKRLSEDLDDVYAVALGRSLGTLVDVVLADASGRRLRRTTEVTIAKRRAAWRYNADNGHDGGR